MLKFLSKLFIKDYKNYQNDKVREKYGFLTSVTGIVLNLILFSVKLFAGILSGAVSVTADAFNNLSDAGSSLLALIGFKLSSKPKDSKHPFGHGRIEYVASLFVAVLIILVGYELITSSIKKIIRPSDVTFSILALSILIISVLVKLYMFAYNLYYSKKINSPVLKATALDSVSDTISTTVVLLAFCLNKVVSFPLDGYIGVLVALFIIFTGLKSLKETVGVLVGEKPDKVLVEEIEKFVLSYDVAVGLHDLIIHNYGINRYIISMHVEVPAEENAVEIHERIDEIEQNLSKKFNCLATIHMDPVFVNDEKTKKYKSLAIEIIKSINPEYTLHDFRMTDGKTNINLIFDVIIPHGEKISTDKIQEKIKAKFKEKDEKLNAVVKCEYSFV